VITFGSTGIVYTAPRFSGDLLDTLAAAGASSGGTASNVNNDNFVRMVMRDPQAAGTKYDGVNSTIEMTSGPAIYYSKGTNPVSAGYVGDIWLTF
jgi:hypothetical protein